MPTDHDYARIRRRLEAERAELQAGINTLSIGNENQQSDNGSSHHPGDDATELFLRERNLALHNNAADLISQIDTALARMDAGEYGRCARCGRQIDAERLEAKPYATMCIGCQVLIEQVQG
jgi:DnaK suppressor protein